MILGRDVCHAFCIKILSDLTQINPFAWPFQIFGRGHACDGLELP